MKILVSRSRFQWVAVVILWGFARAQAQIPGAGDAGGMTAALTKLFGDVTAFTAKAQVQVMDSTNKEIANMPMDFTLLDKKIRVEIDLTQTKNASMPPGAATTLRQMGMAQVISLVRPDKKLVYIIYPDQKAMITMPLPDEDLDVAAKNSKTSKTPLGKETVDGHPCVKNKVVITSEKGEVLEATTWNAIDLQDFPLQIQTKE